MNNREHSFIIDTVDLSETRDAKDSSFVPFSNLFNLDPGKFSPRSSFTLETVVFGLSAFLVHIFKVIGLCSKPKVHRVNARGIITGMKNVFIFGYRSIVNLVRKVMGKKDLVPVTNSAVSFGVFVASPEPTGIGFENLVPESFFDRCMMSSHKETITYGKENVKWKMC